MRYLIFVLIGIGLLWGCVEEQATSDQSITLDQQKEHRTYHNKDDSLLFEAPVELVGNMFLSPMNTYEEAIRISRDNSWGIFEYVATLYERFEVYHLEFVSIHRGYDNRPTINYHKAFVADSIYAEIQSLLQDSGIQELPFFLEDHTAIDGDVYALLIKKGKYQKASIWYHLAHSYRRDSRDKKKVTAVFKQILKIVDYPKPNARLEWWTSKGYKDSVTCRIEFDDYELMDDYIASYKNRSLKRWIKDVPMFNFQIPSQDTLRLWKDLKVQGVLGTDTIDIELTKN